MPANKLMLNVPDILTDCVLRVEDMSVYEPMMPYVCPTVQITVPGFANCVTFDSSTTPSVQKAFILNLTACDLELQFANCGVEFDSIPDGVYTINYSISPNDSSFVEIYNLRTTSLRRQLKEQWCALKLSACEPRPEVELKFKELMTISLYIDAAKANADYCLEPEKAMELYNYAKKKLSNFSCKLY
jgi:hypothetical protein